MNATQIVDSYPVESCMLEVRRRCNNDGDATACLFLSSNINAFSNGLAPIEWTNTVTDAAAHCGMPWLTAQRMTVLHLDTPVWDWTEYDVATLLVFHAIAFALPQDAWSTFLSNWISGATWMRMEVADFVGMGIPFGMAVLHKRGFEDYIQTYFQGPPTFNGEPTMVSVFVMVQRLILVNPPDHFQVELLISLSWNDPRISRNCDGILLDTELDPRDPCTIFWRPQLNYPTALLGEEEPQIVQDFGTWFFVGADSTGPDKSPGLQKSFGQTVYRLRAKFLTVMDYRRYPYDSQTFNLTLLFGDIPASQVQIFGQVTIDIKSYDKHPVWDVISARVVSGVRPQLRAFTFELDELTQFASNDEGVDPALSYLVQLYSDVTESLDNSRAYAEISLEVARYCGYYLGNYIVLEVILVLLGWITFFMSPESVESRLGIALTLVLAINVFQIVLVENLPETGYLTDLSVFTICNTLILALAATESVIVGEATKTVKHSDAICRSARKYMNDPVAIQAANFIQRWVRFRLFVAQISRTCGGRKVTLNPQLAHIMIAASGGSIKKTPRPKARIRRKNPLARILAIIRVKWSKFYCKHARGISTESDRVCAFIIFPAIFASYTAVIFGRSSNSRSSVC